MKSLISFLCLFISTIAWSNDSKEPVRLHMPEGITVEYYEVEDHRIFRNVYFSEISHELHFQTNDKIVMVQIYDAEGRILFQLPVLSNHMVFKKHLLESGQSKIGFVMENDPTVHFTKITSL